MAASPLDRGEPTWYDRNETALHIGAAVVIGAALLWAGFYEWFLGRGFLSLLAFVVGLPVLVFLAHVRAESDEPIAAVWATAGAVLLFSVAIQAFADARAHLFSNCWAIQEPGSRGVSIWECAPGRSKPVEWGPGSEGDGSARLCRHIDTSSSGGTIWRCEDD